MNQLQSIHVLLELDVLVRELGLVLYLAKLLLDHLLRACSKGREVRTSRNKKQEQSMSAGFREASIVTCELTYPTTTSNAQDPGKRGRSLLPEILSERLHSVHDVGYYNKTSGSGNSI